MSIDCLCVMAYLQNNFSFLINAEDVLVVSDSYDEKSRYSQTRVLLHNVRLYDLEEQAGLHKEMLTGQDGHKGARVIINYRGIGDLDSGVLSNR